MQSLISYTLMIIDSIGKYKKGLAGKRVERYMLRYIALRNSIRDAIRNHITCAQVRFYPGCDSTKLSKSVPHQKFKGKSVLPHHILGLKQGG